MNLLSPRICTAFPAFLGLLFLVSCAAGETEPARDCVPEGKTLSPSGSGELRLGDDLLNAIRDGSYADFTRTLAGKTDFDISRQDFTSSCEGVTEKYGRPVSWTHLTALADPVADQNVWKVHFVKERAEGKAVERDMLFRLVCARIGEKTSVLAFGFF